MHEPDTCLKCNRILSDYDDYPPIAVPGMGELCSDCYNELSSKERLIYFKVV